VMTRNVVSCSEDDPVAEAARLMQERQIRRLLVLDRDQRLTGIVSLGDLAAEADDPYRMAEVLQDVSVPAVPRR